MPKASQAIAVTVEKNKVVKTRLFYAFLFFSLTLFILGISRASAEDKKVNLNEQQHVQQAAADFIDILANKALAIISENRGNQLKQEDEFRTLLNEGFNIKYIGKLSIGRHRKKASTAQLTQYYDLFPEYLIKTYVTRLSKLDTKSVIIGNVIPNGKKDMYVRSNIINGEDKSFDVDWRVRPYKNDVYKIIDVKIEGVSMARTQRDDFTSRIMESGVEGLNDYMTKVIEGQMEAEISDELESSDSLAKSTSVTTQ